MKRLVVTTSTSCLDYVDHNYDIRTIRIKIDINGTLKEDGTEIKAEDFYKMMDENKHLVPKTSQPSIGELVEMFEGYAEEGYDEIIVTTISSKLSGTFNGICKAAEILEDKIKIHVYDTKTVCFNEGFFALTAARMIEEGKPTDEILKQLDFMRDHNTILFAVDSLECLVKNGRLSGAAGFIGTFLKIKPLLQVVADGSIQAIDKIRTTKKALEVVSEKIKDYVQGHNYIATIVYTGDSLKSYFVDVLNEKAGLSGLDEHPCSPVVGCHVGSQAIGIGAFLLD